MNVATSALPARVFDAAARYDFRQSLHAANASFAAGATQLASIPRDEPSDVDGPLGVATDSITAGVTLLKNAIAGTAKGVDGDRLAASSAIADASASADLLWHWDNNGWGNGDTGSATAVLTAATQLVNSARDSLDAVLGDGASAE